MQNRILAQPIDWSVRVVHTEPSRVSTSNVGLVCHAVDAAGNDMGSPFFVEMVGTEPDSLQLSNDKAALYQLAGTIDPRIEFSAEHAAGGPWYRDGTAVAPYCASRWIVNGTQLTEISGQ
ncbi:MAG: hypothetical protein EXS01_00230 [Phycisphaerales bacterium]|nr:hypothetical protein [Phycisphaerales bacterium]